MQSACVPTNWLYRGGSIYVTGSLLSEKLKTDARRRCSFLEYKGKVKATEVKNPSLLPPPSLKWNGAVAGASADSVPNAGQRRPAAG